MKDGVPAAKCELRRFDVTHDENIALAGGLSKKIEEDLDIPPERYPFFGLISPWQTFTFEKRIRLPSLVPIDIYNNATAKKILRFPK